jgi:hypothetical protein
MCASLQSLLSSFSPLMPSQCKISLFCCDDIVTCIHIARQRLGKHIPTQAYARNDRTSVLRQRISKHTSLKIEAMFSVGSVQSGYKEMFGSV